MIRILGIAFLLALASYLYGQSSGNPFDLKYRSAKPNTSSTVVKKVSPDTVQAGGTTLAINSDKPSTPKESIITPKQTPSDTTKDNSSQNPFELKTENEPVPGVSEPSKDLKEISGVEKEQRPLVSQGKTSKGFQIFFVLLSLLFLIFIVNVERSFVRDLWKVISNENYSSLHHRNQRNTMRQILLIMGYAVFVLQAGLFLYQGLKIYRYEGTVLDNIWLTTLLILLIYLVRHTVIRYLRWLFNNDKEMTLFSFDISIFNTMVGLVLLPVNILLLFGPDSFHKPLIIMGVITIVVAYLLRQFRWMLSASQLISRSLFLFFVYLCAVEILPLWAISKLFW